MSAHNNDTTHRVDDSETAAPLAAEPTEAERQEIERCLTTVLLSCLDEPPPPDSVVYARALYTALATRTSDPDQQALMSFLRDFYTRPLFRNEVITIISQVLEARNEGSAS